jgi:Flp pilus assembly protein TadD
MGVPDISADSSGRNKIPDRVIASVLGGGLFLSTFYSYIPVFSAGFLNYDDNQYVVSNPMVNNGLSWKGVWAAVTSVHAANWHPLTWLSHAADVTLFGMNPTGHHAVNLFLHALNVLVLFSVLRRLTGATYRSAAVAGLFALHPLHVESVAWIAERKDLLCAFFSLLSARSYLSRPPGSGGKVPPAALGWFVMALLSKPMAVTLPFVFVLMDQWAEWRIDIPALRKAFAEKRVMLFLSLLSCVVTIAAQVAYKAIIPVKAWPIASRLSNVPIAYAKYLFMTFWPARLGVFYPVSGTPLPLAGAVLAIAGLTAATFAIVRMRKRFPYLPVGWFWFLGMLVPVIGIVQVGSQAMADRYTYLPLIGIFIITVWGVYDLAGRLNIRGVELGASAVLLLIVLGVLTWRQAGYWRTTETLFRHTLDVTSPGNPVARGMYANAYFERGEFDEATRLFSASLAENPMDYFANFGIGRILLLRGRPAESIPYLQRALDASSLPDGYLMAQIGQAMVKSGRREEGIDHLRTGVRLSPEDPDTHSLLGLALAAEGSSREAVEELRKVVVLSPRNATAHYNLGVALDNAGRFPEAVRSYRDAIALRKSDPAAWSNLGIAYGRMQRFDDAIEALREAERLDPENPDIPFNLGLAFQGRGEVAEARRHFDRANRLERGKKGRPRGGADG